MNNSKILRDNAEGASSAPEMVESTLPILTAAAGKELLKKSVGDLYDYVKSRTARQFLRWHSDKNIAKAYAKLLTIRKVKTLWQVDKAVDLTSFYCPSHVKIDANRRRVDTLDDLDVRENVLIEGIAGQGKSILLRYLSAVETARRGKVPIFIELRLIEPGESIKSHIMAFLSDLRVECDDELFDFLMESGRVVLLLDAFDELDEAVVLGVLKELEHFSVRYEALKIIVTSRRSSELRVSRFFHVVALSDLQGTEYALVIRKLLDFSPLAEHLIRRVRNEGGPIREVLTTPLLVTLLVLIYKSYQEIPSQMSEFYESLFQLLLQRHDGAKPGFRRKRRCKALNDAQYRKVFEAFCYNAKKLKPNSMRSQEIYETAEEAFTNVAITGDAEDFIKDIVQITCLILEEAGEYRFIHKSVQEFYAACFLRRKPESIVRQLYPKLMTAPALFTWQNEVKFLQEIDTYRLNKFALLPSLLSILGISEEMLQEPMPKTSVASVRRWIGQLTYTFDAEGLLQNVSGATLDSPFREEAFSAIPNLDRIAKINPQEFIAMKSKHVLPSKHSVEFFATTWERAASKGVGAKELDEGAERVAPVMFEKARKIRQHIEIEERDTPLTTIL